MYYASIECSIYMRARAPGGRRCGLVGAEAGWMGGVCARRGGWRSMAPREEVGPEGVPREGCGGPCGGGRPGGREVEGGRWKGEGPTYKRDLVSTDLLHHAE